jgi:hypothetical protein
VGAPLVHRRTFATVSPIGTLPFDLGVVEWAISSTATAVDFWRACVEHAGEAG